MTTAPQRHRRRGNGRGAPPPADPFSLVRDDNLRCLVERLDEALDVIDDVERQYPVASFVIIEHNKLDEIASAIQEASDVLAELRSTGRLP